MKYTVQLIIDDNLSLTLGEIDIQKSEVQNLIDALNCEVEYNDFTMLSSL